MPTTYPGKTPPAGKPGSRKPKRPRPPRKYAGSGPKAPIVRTKRKRR